MVNDDKSRKTYVFSDENIAKLLTAEQNISNLFEHVQALIRRVDRLEEAYYEAYPDRKAKDQAIERQLNALKNNRDPDSPPDQK